MDERAKIIESIKKGILSPEEGLDLLEFIDHPKETTDSTVDEPAEKAELQLEQEVAVTVDESEASLTEMGGSLDEPAESLAEALEAPEKGMEPAVDVAEEAEPQVDIPEPLASDTQSKDSVASLIDEWENGLESSSAENDSIRPKITEFDEVLQTKIEALRAKKAEFRELNLEAELGILSAENEVLYNEMKIELKQQEEELELLKYERQALGEELFTTEKRDEAPKFFEVPDDFEEQSYRPMDRPQVQANDFGSRFGRIVSKAAKTVSETVGHEFDWQNVNQKLYGTAKTHFSHQFVFENNAARTIDIKLAKGKVVLKTWTDETIMDVKVEATVALLGKMEESDPLEAFLKRSQIEVNNAQILFHVPNKRVKAELTVYLPRRHYHELSIRLLNGDVLIDELRAKNVAINVTKGDLLIQQMDAAMLEITGTNNEIELRKGEVLDLFAETVTGTIISSADSASAEYSLINGDIKLTVGNADLKKIVANSVNGDVKVALPQGTGIAGVAKTGSGTINYRLANYETVQERLGETQKILHFTRSAEPTAEVAVSSKAGNIYLKDYDKGGR